MDIHDFLHSVLPESWFDNVHIAFKGLTDEEITASVHEASDFFNMNDPMDIHEDWTTGVLTRMPSTADDDVLVFNRAQMEQLGITDKEGFDLVMTHEGAHRALQGLNTGFNEHQEELCCDYMAGVRAGLNGLDETKMEASLIGTPESVSHPGGVERVEAIKAGVAFAHDYMEEHGIAPKFSECLEHFKTEDVFLKPFASGHVTLTPEDSDVVSKHEAPNFELGNGLKGFTEKDVEWYEHQASISSGSEQLHWLKEAEWASNHLHGFVSEEEIGNLKGYTQKDVEWYEHQARISSGSEQAHWLKEAQWARDHIHGFANPFSHHPSGFDANHPMPDFDGLRNMGFSARMADQILYGGSHCYSQKELFNVLYNSDDPVKAYNELVEGKARAAMDRADKLADEIEKEFGI